MLDDIIISVPKDENLKTIISTSPLVIEQSPETLGLDTEKRVRLSGIEPSRLTRLFVPMNSPSSVDHVRVINAKDKRLTIRPITDIRNPFLVSVARMLIPVSFFAIGIGFVFLYHETAMHRINEDLSRIKQESQGLIEQLDQIKNESQRLKLLLVSRLSDYHKELSFWRDTIRKILYGAGKSKSNAEAIINEVTRTLKTFGTTESYDDNFDAIRIAADMISRDKDKGKTD